MSAPGKVLSPGDPKAWAAAITSVGAGAVAFVQSDQWEVAALIGFNIMLFALLGLMVKQRMDKLEGLLSKCQESHRQCEAWKTNALTAIAVLHTRLARHDATLPPLSDLLGPDALSAMIHASEVEAQSHRH